MQHFFQNMAIFQKGVLALKCVIGCQTLQIHTLDQVGRLSSEQQTRSAVEHSNFNLRLQEVSKLCSNC